MTIRLVFSATSFYHCKMLRKPTRPRMVDMPRRPPSLRLSPRCPNQRLRVKKKRVTFAPEPQFFPSTEPAQTAGTSVVMPSRVLVSAYALDARSILRDVLTANSIDGKEAVNYRLEARQKSPEQDLMQVDEGSEIPVFLPLRDRCGATSSPAFAKFKTHRLWKLLPGVYCLVDSDKHRREVLLRVGKYVVRTPLPDGVPNPPDSDTGKKIFLEIATPRDGLRVTAKWLSV